MAAGTHPAVHAEKKKRGPKPKWDWELIDAEATSLYAQSDGTMPWKVLVETIQIIAKRQTRSTIQQHGEERAAGIRVA